MAETKHKKLNHTSNAGLIFSVLALFGALMTGSLLSSVPARTDEPMGHALIGLMRIMPMISTLLTGLVSFGLGIMGLSLSHANRHDSTATKTQIGIALSVTACIAILVIGVMVVYNLYRR